MGMIALRCPSCDGDIELDDSREYGFCLHCGTRILIQDAINRIQISGKVELDMSQAERNCENLAQNAYQSGNYAEAYTYFTKVLEYNSENYMAVFRKGICAGYLSELDDIRKEEVLQGYTGALALLEKKYGSYKKTGNETVDSVGSIESNASGNGEVEGNESENNTTDNGITESDAAGSSLTEGNTSENGDANAIRKQMTDELIGYLTANVNAAKDIDTGSVFPNLQEAEFAIGVIDEISEVLYMGAECLDLSFEEEKKKLYRAAATVCGKVYPSRHELKYIKDITVDPKTGKNVENTEYVKIAKETFEALEKRRKEISDSYRKLPTIVAEQERIAHEIEEQNTAIATYKAEEKEFFDKNPQAKSDFARIYWLSAATLLILDGLVILALFLFYRANWANTSLIVSACVAGAWILYTTIRRLTFRKQVFTPELMEKYKKMKSNKQSLRKIKTEKKIFQNELL